MHRNCALSCAWQIAGTKTNPQILLTNLINKDFLKNGYMKNS